MRSSPPCQVLDLCCGTGTIGICLASKVAQVIGIELVEEAVNDAKDNIERNNVQNMTVMAGKVEDKVVLLGFQIGAHILTSCS